FKMNRHIKEIYFKAAKEFSAFDKIETLNAYVMYYSLSYKAGTKTVVIPVRVRKTLFKNPEEHLAFLEIVEALKGDNQPGIALKKVIEGFSAGRKKITLDETKIAGIKTRHSQTAGKLGEILKDDGEEQETPSRPTPTTGGTPLKLENVFETPAPGAADIPAIKWEPIQEAFLMLFFQNGYVLEGSKTASFARKHKQFESRLIDGINELFSEEYDDILIEEEDGEYTINAEYRGHLEGEVHSFKINKGEI
ncbi:MAG: hypothetical protein GY757_57255, partial [bacterium]|nr:hypothetical protein [bacterium]